MSLNDFSSVGKNISSTQANLYTNNAYPFVESNIMSHLYSRRIQTILEVQRDVILEIDAQGVIQYVSPGVNRVFHIPDTFLLGHRFTEFMPYELRADYNKFYEHFMAGDKETLFFEFPLLISSHKVRNVNVFIKPLMDDAGNRFASIASVKDISARKRLMNTIRHMAIHDSLTDMASRAQFVDRLIHLLTDEEQNKRFAILLLDLDHFKRINDSFGFSFGDMILQAFSIRLKKILPINYLIARMAGDEFGILLEGSERVSWVEQIARQILQSFEKPYNVQGHDFYVTCSIGISIFPENGDDMQALLKNAESAMNIAKERGRNQFCLYHATMNANIVERLNVENGLRRALAADQFILYYQPKVDMITGKISGVEALLRWRAEDGNIVFPSNFIPIAEEIGLIIPIGDQILYKAANEMVEWQREGINNINIGVNISPRQFSQSDFIQQVKTMLAKTGLNPALLNIEITEGVAIRDLDHTIKIMIELKKLGVTISLDDFGVGYSSLSYLMQLPVNILKLDKSFVDNIYSSDRVRDIISVIIDMAHRLDMKVVAEGVENRQQMEILRSQGCDEIQGFYFSQAMPSDMIKAMIKGDALRLLL